jgi:hypothetical protein
MHRHCQARIFVKPLILLIFLGLISVVAAQAFAAGPRQQQTQATATSASLAGVWRVTLSFNGDVERHLTFEAQAKGVGSFSLLDTRPDNKPEPAALPAVWSQLTNNRVSISGEAELPLGTCCREWGTLMLKGNFTNSDTISGKIIFVTSVDEEESPYQFHSQVGTFTATRQAK